MTLTIEQIAQKLNIPLEKLLRESLLAYVTQQERLTDEGIADLRDRYRVSTPKELSMRIEKGEVYSHPAWEDLIEWENLQAYLKQLGELRASLN